MQNLVSENNWVCKHYQVQVCIQPQLTGLQNSLDMPPEQCVSSITCIMGIYSKTNFAQMCNSGIDKSLVHWCHVEASNCLILSPVTPFSVDVLWRRRNNLPALSSFGAFTVGRHKFNPGFRMCFKDNVVGKILYFDEKRK